MKRATAVRHLSEMAEVACDRLRLRDSDLGWPLEELWVAGALLDDVDTLEYGAVVLSLSIEPSQLPWLALHPVGEWVAQELRLGKRPFSWAYRPAAWPAWNPKDQRLVRIWTARNGAEVEAIKALRDGDLESLIVVEPSPTEMLEHFEAELVESRRHLDEVLERFWEPDWRRDRRAGDGPDDHLWRAAEAVRGIERALARTRR